MVNAICCLAVKVCNASPGCLLSAVHQALSTDVGLQPRSIPGPSLPCSRAPFSARNPRAPEPEGDGALVSRIFCGDARAFRVVETLVHMGLLHFDLHVDIVCMPSTCLFIYSWTIPALCWLHIVIFKVLSTCINQDGMNHYEITFSRCFFGYAPHAPRAVHYGMNVPRGRTSRLDRLRATCTRSPRLR
ncbi:hypothetical protein FA95DRAFT_868044 [Auriscalpium vulgare]|uniref:Uncharacterized protein n=1 Tax=Auriscalpium vulgare TaxID=40419 RepID=A0ACB8R993_9AGAM|nr:hypothetical protein FA95DRAFT_868044 [Auriscalpium vulgare]